MDSHLSARQIADDLVDRIAHGEYTAADQIPSYARAAQLYDVSVSTVKRAYLLLSDRGVVRGEPGRGVFVNPAAAAAIGAAAAAR